MSLTHLSTVGYQSSPAMRSMTDTIYLYFSLSLFPSSLHTHAPHPSQQYCWLLVITGGEINDRRSLSLSFSPFPSFLHTHAPHPSQQYHRLSVVIGGEVNDQHGLSLSLPFFPSFSLSLSHLPIFTMPSFNIGYTNHHQPSPISIIPLRRPLLPSLLLPIFDSHLSPPILASPHLLSIRHLWSSFPCSPNYHHYSLPIFLSQASTTAP